MTLDDFDLMNATTAPNPAAVRAKCRRHLWVAFPDGTRCDRCSRPLDKAQASRNNRARKRGFRTSHDLADYLHGRDVDKQGWPWDVTARGCRVQCKRLATRPSPAALVKLLEAIPYQINELRAVFYVEPGRRLTSGVIVAGLKEWTDWHGWTFPVGARLFLAGTDALIEMPLPAFADAHIGGEPK
jgi:hypothetical protein